MKRMKLIVSPLALPGRANEDHNKGDNSTLIGSVTRACPRPKSLAGSTSLGFRQQGRGSERGSERGKERGGGRRNKGWGTNRKGWGKRREVEEEEERVMRVLLPFFSIRPALTEHEG